MQYKTKPVMVEAVRFEGFNKNGQVDFNDRPEWLVGEFGTKVRFFEMQNTLTLVSSDGLNIVEAGDFIVRHTDGELKLVKANLFYETYERYLVWD